METSIAPESVGPYEDAHIQLKNLYLKILGSWTYWRIVFSDDYRAKASVSAGCVARYDTVRTMDRKGNCWDNAMMERFFLSLKMERGLATGRCQPGGSTTRHCTSTVGIYHFVRLHSTLSQLWPAVFAQLKTVQQPIRVSEKACPAHATLLFSIFGALLGGKADVAGFASA